MKPPFPLRNWFFQTLPRLVILSAFVASADRAHADPTVPLTFFPYSPLSTPGFSVTGVVDVDTLTGAILGGALTIDGAVFTAADLGGFIFQNPTTPPMAFLGGGVVPVTVNNVELFEAGLDLTIAGVNYTSLTIIDGNIKAEGVVVGSWFSPALSKTDSTTVLLLFVPSLAALALAARRFKPVKQ